ncbi:MAG: ABC transporter permease [Defluviitaleaceae bacterium]|nr:ABC transporter permease [Defluviitaleaceae bacterium]
MTIFKMAIKRILGQPINWIFILMFPLVFSMLITLGNNPDEDSPWMAGSYMPIGIVDHDNSTLSNALVSQLEIRFPIIKLQEEYINEALAGLDTAWVLVIHDGYSENVLAGIPPALDSYSLMINDLAIIGNRMAQNLTQAFMILGADDPAVLHEWEESSRLEMTIVGEANFWSTVAQLTGMYGFVAMFMAFFIIRTLMDDRLLGMPERLGVLPISPRKIMVQGTLAAFGSTLFASAVLVLFLNFRLGYVPNPVHLFTILALFNLFTVAFVFAIYSSVKTMAAVSVIVTMIANIFSMLGGLFWPLEMVPQFMQRIAWFTPTYWFAQGLRNIHEISFEGFIMPVLFMLGFTLVAMLLGGWKRIQAVDE